MKVKLSSKGIACIAFVTFFSKLSMLIHGFLKLLLMKYHLELDRHHLIGLLHMALTEEVQNSSDSQQLLADDNDVWDMFAVLSCLWTTHRGEPSTSVIFIISRSICLYAVSVLRKKDE